jgi:molybdopterin-guanine dinucleotide biosynthesis protein A
MPLYILAGGHSTRFGSNKALADVGGRPLVLHVVEQFQIPHPILIANQERDYRHLGLPIIPDPIPDLGPIGGLLAACEHLPAPGWFLLSGCDILFTRPDAAALLMAAAGTAIQAVAFRDKHWEPLPALYHSTILPEVRRHIQEGGRSLWKLIERLPHRALPFPQGRSPFRHINTREDLRDLELTR